MPGRQTRPEIFPIITEPEELRMNTADIGLANWFLQRALRTPERAALGFEGRSWSYAQMQQSIEQLAGRLHGLGGGRGDRLAFLGLNQPMFLLPVFGSALRGAMFVC